MRLRRFSYLLLIASLTARAADLKIKVVDPQSAAVRGAQVALYPAGSSEAVALGNSSAEGTLAFTVLSPGDYRIEVLAPGFAPVKLDVRVPPEASAEVQLKVAGPEQTVVVTATRTPVTEQDAGIPVAVLDQPELINIQPVSEADALRFLPGAIINTTGRRGSQSSLFVRGGESDYNKVLIDGVPVDDPGGFFDFGVVTMQEADRLEFLRGSQSTLYGSDAMTSVTQLWTATGSTRVPELRFGADGGNFYTANGFVAFAGARGRFDYNLFADQFYTAGQGINDEYSNSSQGENVGIRVTPKAMLRVHARHSNSWTGVQSNWNFNGQPLLPPDSDQKARQNNFLASTDLNFTSGTHWQHRISGFEYHHRRSNSDNFIDPGRGCDFVTTFLDCPFNQLVKVNRAGFELQSSYSPRTWTTTSLGLYFEDENGHDTESGSGSDTRGLRRNAAGYVQQVLIFSRWSLIPGVRFEHNESFGNKAVPRVAATFLAQRGGDVLSSTRLRFVYGEGIKEPSLEASFGIPAFLILQNPLLKPEQTRSLEGGVQQSFFRDKVSVSASYFNNLFTNQIECCVAVDAKAGTSEFFNLNKSFAHGSELQIESRLTARLRVDGSYTYTSTQILNAPLGSGALFSAGASLLRRPKHSGTLLISYFGNRWGASLVGTFVGPRPDSDFTQFLIPAGIVPPINHVAGYARIDPGAWYAINSRITAYVNVQNVFNQHYQEVVGYPGLRVNVRAGMRYRIGGE
jgi:outer membrane cobalamin receptor